MQRFRFAAAGVLAALATLAPSHADDADTFDGAAFDAFVADAMDAFDMPGVAVAVISHGEIVHMKGYGVREIGGRAPVDTHTLFGIASNTKAMTTAALAILVDEGQLDWDDRVTDHIPEFRIGDAYMTHEFRIRDLLIHQSGLGPGAGDLMVFPETDFTMDDIIAGLPHLPVTGEFRTEFSYDNLLYGVAGEVIRRVSGQSWADFMEERVFAPAGMTRCKARLDRVRTRNIASRHAEADGALQVVDSWSVGAVAPAGDVNCDIEDMARWASVMLADGALSDGGRLVSAEQFAELTKPRTIIPVAGMPREDEAFGTTAATYAFGWMLTDRDGQLTMWHTGGLIGMVSMVALVPGSDSAVVVLTNQQSGAGRRAIAAYALKELLGAEQRDWIAFYSDLIADYFSQFDAVEAEVADTIAHAGPPPAPLADYVGTYRDPWRGDATVREEDGRLILTFSRTDHLEGPLEHYRNGVFVVRWNDRTLSADAFVRFSVGFDGRVDGMTMKAVSGRTDFSFDFHDLDFEKVEAIP